MCVVASFPPKTAKPSTAPSTAPSEEPSEEPSTAPSTAPSEEPSTAPSTAPAAAVIQATLGSFQNTPLPADVGKGDFGDAKDEIKKALDDANKSPPNIDGAIKDLSKAAEEIKCDEPQPPSFSDAKKDLCNLIANTIIKLAAPLHTQSIFVAPLRDASSALPTAETKLQAHLAAIKDGILISGLKTTLTEGEVEDAIKEVEDARDEFNIGNNAKAIEKLTKASDDLSCDQGPGLEKTRQDVCNLIIDSIVAVANDMKLS